MYEEKTLHRKYGIKGREEEEDERETKGKYNGEGKVEEIGTNHGSYKEERKGNEKSRARKEEQEMRIKGGEMERVGQVQDR